VTTHWLPFRLLLIPVSGLALATASAPAWAALAGSVGSIEADRVHLAAAHRVDTMTNYVMHTLTLANQSQVREFARPDGVVFAVAWTGPSRPDLRQLLGPKFATLQAENAVVNHRRTHRGLTVSHSDFVVRSGGHSGAFQGWALAPNFMPAGFPMSNLR